MKIQCAKCGGYRETVQVSGDYDQRQAAGFRARALSVRFICEGVITDHYFLSPEFCAKYGIVPGDYPLPDTDPDWEQGVRLVCATCFEVEG